MQRHDLFGAAQEGPYGIASAVIKFEDIIERCRLTIAEIGRRFGYLPQSFSAPQSNRNRLAAEVAIPRRRGVIAEMTIHVEISAGNRGITNQRLVKDAA